MMAGLDMFIRCAKLDMIPQIQRFSIIQSIFFFYGI